MQQENKNIYLIGIVGGSGAGKTFLAKKIQSLLLPIESELIPQDDYYRDKTHMTMAERKRCNYDEPASIDFELLRQNLNELKLGNSIRHPLYDFKTHNQSGQTRKIEPVPVIIVDGILLFTNKELADLFDLRVFIDISADIRLARRLRRDVTERGRNMDSVLNQIQETVSPMYYKYVEPSKSLADIVIQGVGDMAVVTEMVSAWLKMKLDI